MDPNFIQLIGYVLSLVGVLVTVIYNNKTSSDKITSSLKTNQAITDTKIENITKELNKLNLDIKEHNNYAQRMPVIEEQLKTLTRINYSDRLSSLETRETVAEEKISSANKRISSLEQTVAELKKTN